MLRRETIGLFVCLSTLVAVCAAGQPRQNATHSPIHKDKPHDYAPGVRIDWSRRVVEVDAKVVLREGALELLVCSPHTREHESILVVQARPLHIYQAMGLIGLQPGSPIRYDAKSGRTRPPRGEPLDLSVRYRKSGVLITAQAEDWLTDMKRAKSARSLEWVFAGSRTLGEGRFGADEEGTVVCVVDFATALIAPKSLHTSDDEFLWLSANTAAIPPVGTDCTLLIKSASTPAFEIAVVVAPDGTLRRGGRLIAGIDLLPLMHREDPGFSGVSIVVYAAAEVTKATVAAAVEALVRSGIGRGVIEVRHGGKPLPTADPGKPHSGS